MKKNLGLPVIFLLYFLSGACGLAYQVAWVRMFGLVFGNTFFAAGTVLAAFMAGLAGGAYISGKYWAKRNDTLRVYAIVEGGIGLSALLMPVAIGCISVLYSWVYQSANPSFEVLTAVRFVLSFAVLAVPCVFMGATLPLVTKWVIEERKARMGSIGALYGLNTIGAVAGCVAAGFYLIRELGISGTVYCAAGVNFLVAIAAIGLFIRQGRGGGFAVDSARGDGAALSKKNTVAANVLLVCAALSGFAALALEITWSRALSRIFQFAWTFQMDAYAIVVVLTVVLAGIGIGSYVAVPVIARSKRYDNALWIVQLLIGIAVVASIALIQHPVQLRHALFSMMNAPIAGWLWAFGVRMLGPQVAMQFGIGLAVMGIPALLMGMAFPLFALRYAQLTGKISSGVGTLYSVNTIGAIAGSLIAGFLLVPVAGLLPSIALMGGFYCVSALLVVASSGSSRASIVVRSLIVVSVSAIAIVSVDLDYAHFLKAVIPSSSTGNGGEVEYFKEDAGGGILVTKNEYDGVDLYNEGTIVAASTGPNLFSHIFPAHLVSLLAKGPREMLIIGFGCGITSGSLLRYDEVTRLDAVEISRGIIGPAKKYFGQASSDVFLDPRLHLIFQDGKNYVRMADKKYGVIYACPSLPQANSGSAGLFTREFFEECKKRLSPGGFQCAWVPLHMYRPEDFLTVVRTFSSVYPHVMVWNPPQTELSAGLAYLIGSEEAIAPDYQAIAEKLARPKVRDDLKRLNEAAFSTPEEFITMFALGDEGIRKICAGEQSINTDDRPIIEFYDRSKDLIQSALLTKIATLETFGKNTEDPWKRVQGVPIMMSDTVRARMARLFEGKQYLLLGHSAATYRQLYAGSVPADLDQKIIALYSRAFVLMPENAFLRSVFQK